MGRTNEEKRTHDMDDIDGGRERLTEHLHRLGIENDVSGASVAVLAGGEVVGATFGVVSTRSGVPVTSDTLFMIQSITKIITATMAMQLVDDGLVGLDDSVRRHLPEFRTADREVSGRITLRHLLTHTGGFEGDLWAATTSGPDAVQRFVEDIVAVARQNSDPGERFSYCNAGFGVLGRLVEVLRGVTYEEAVRRFVAEPLGIDELAFSADEALAFRTAIGHVRPNPDAALQPLRNWAVMPPSNPAAGNQLAMSARGLLAIARMHLADGQSPDATTRVLSAPSSRLMRERQIDHPAVLGPRSAHGLGWWLQRGELVEHGGGSTGVAAMLRTAPRHRLAAVVLTNAESGGKLIDDLLEPWFADLADVAPSTKFSTPTADARVADPRPYVGRYQSRQGRFEVARGHDDQLWLTHTPQHETLEFAERAGVTVDVKRYELRPVGDGIFTTIEAGHTGEEAQAIEFLGRDSHARARFLFSGGRASPRVD